MQNQKSKNLISEIRRRLPPEGKRRTPSGGVADFGNPNINDVWKSLIVIVILGLVLPNLSLAQEAPITAPQTLNEASSFALGILQKLPEAVKNVWREEALPVWQKMWEWVKPIIEPWWQKLLGLLGKEVEKRRPDIEKQFQEEKSEMQKDLWGRFKDLLR